MELTAICEALEMLTGAIEVRTDSTYVDNCFNRNWTIAVSMSERGWPGSCRLLPSMPNKSSRCS